MKDDELTHGDLKGFFDQLRRAPAKDPYDPFGRQEYKHVKGEFDDDSRTPKPQPYPLRTPKKGGK